MLSGYAVGADIKFSFLNQGNCPGHDIGRFADKNLLKTCLNLVNSSLSFVSFCSMPGHEIFTPFRNGSLDSFRPVQRICSRTSDVQLPVLRIQKLIYMRTEVYNPHKTIKISWVLSNINVYIRHILCMIYYVWYSTKYIPRVYKTQKWQMNHIIHSL